jgi:excisionase family DNA binding protein
MADVLNALIDQFADTVARRVIERIDEHLEARGGGVAQDAYRVDQAAQALGLSEGEVRKQIATGQLGHKRVGRAVLVPRSAIDEFLASEPVQLSSKRGA